MRASPHNLAGALAGLALGLLATSNTAPAAPRASEVRLANGLELVVIPDKRAPVVTHIIAYRVGAADDPPGVSGLAHFLEHLMFKSTVTQPAGAFARAISRLGGRDNAVTTPDATIYHQRVPRDGLATVMALEADRMRNLRLSEDEVALEREVIIEERRTRIDGSPIDRLNEEMGPLLHPNHPYRIPVLGWAHEMSRLTREDALAFYRTHYAPDNALVVVAGDIEMAEARRLAETAYGGLTPRGASRPRLRPQDPPPRAARRVTLYDHRIAGPALVRAYVVPSVAGAKPGEADALEVLARVLAVGETSRLHRRLVSRSGGALLVEGGYSRATRDSGQLAIYVQAVQGTDLAGLEADLDAEIAAACAGGIDADELARAVSVIEAARVFAADSQLANARRYAEAIANGGSLEAIAAREARLHTITPADVAAAACTHLTVERAVTGVLLPATDAMARRAPGKT